MHHRNRSDRLPGRLHPGRHGLDLRLHRQSSRRLRFLYPERPAATLSRHHDQRSAGRSSALRFHGGDAGALPYRRCPAHHHGPALRRPARRARYLRRAGRRPAGRFDGYRWCDRGHHGSAVAAGDDAGRLRSETGGWRNLRVGHPGADHSALGGADLRWRLSAERQSGSPVGDGQPHPRSALGRSALHRCPVTGPDAGRALHRLGAVEGLQ